MEKNTYETYEYLPANNSEAESDQLFVVQDDGTFLLNRQVQYVAQVQDIKEVLEEVQPCTVYGVGVSSQQFYVDNSTELISVPDQFILPPGENNIYSNGYLLQPTSSNDTEQIEEDVGDHLKQSTTPEPNVAATTTSNGNNFTEITLSDEQYQTLEHKGWILLEANNKTFVLNTLGLHDITSDDKLVQELRNEIQNDNNSETGSGRNIKIETVKQEISSLGTQPFANEQAPVEFVVENNEDQDNINNIQFIITEKEDVGELNNLENEEHMEICDDNQESNVKCHLINEIATVKQEPLLDKSTIKIKTKYKFKDIPKKFVLGKTVNGKRLVAKVVKTVTNIDVVNIAKNQNNEDLVKNEQNINQNAAISETELISLIQQSVRMSLQKKIKPEVVKCTKNVIVPLLKVPNLKNSLAGHNVIITKVRHNIGESGVINKNKVTLLTGRVVNKDDSTAVFEFLPDLLQTIRTNSEESMTDENQHLECIDHEKETFMIFHIHILETKGTDKVVRVSVTLNKRQLSINQMFDMKKRHPNTVFACSACATLFKSETALKEHQENDCLDTDEMLTIDVDKTDMVDAYSIIKSENNKTFTCKQCNTNFPKLYTCVRHVKTHFGLHQPSLATSKEKETSNEQEEEKTQNQNNKAIYKCKMCPSTYFHPSTLSKHIVTRHIKVKSK